MAEQTENTPNAEGAASGSSGGGSQRSSSAVSRSSSAVRSRGEGVLTSDRGTTSLSDAVVTKVASIAAREVAGVYELGGGTARAIGNVGQRVGLGTQRTQGVSVEVGEREAAIDLTLVLDYGNRSPGCPRKFATTSSSASRGSPASLSRRSTSPSTISTSRETRPPPSQRELSSRRCRRPPPVPTCRRRSAQARRARSSVESRWTPPRGYRRWPTA